MWNKANTLKGNLPALDCSKSIEFSDLRYREYFEFYGFDCLRGLFDTYHFGAIEGKQGCACHYWRRQGASRTVFVLHGLFDHVGLFLPLVENLLSQNLNVIAIDLPDHGLSGFEYGTLDSFSYYSSAVASVVYSDQISIEGPLTLLGQSTGGAALFDFLSNNQGAPIIDQLILLAPLLRVRGWAGIQLGFRMLGWGLKSVPRSFQPSSHDEKFCHFLRDRDPMQPKFVSTAWVGAMLDWARRFEALPKVTVPTLYVQGSCDSTVDFTYNISRYREKINDMNLCIVEGAKHHLVGEADPWRAQVFSVINRFIAGTAS